MTQYWLLEDPRAGDSFRVLRNPNTMSSPVQPHETEVRPFSPIDGQARPRRSPAKPYEWTFGGVLVTQEHYQAFVQWAARPNRILLTDHLNRTFDVRLTHFEPAAQHHKNSWRFEYTMHALVYGRVR